MKSSSSINIERDTNKQLDYVVTANATRVLSNIVNAYNAGQHSFTLIGSYGTGKSSFILALEDCLKNDNHNPKRLLKNEGQFNGKRHFHFLNIVGDYALLHDLIEEKIGNKRKNFFQNLDNYYQNIHQNGSFLIIVIDEFGKVLEHAAKNDPEKEMYFLQKFAEYVNDTDKDILLLTTLHQGFNAYSKNLQEEQRQEWTKVKGRFTEIVFREPVEQLLDLAAKRLERKSRKSADGTSADRVYELALESKFFYEKLKKDTARKLYPMDIIAAYTFVQANQRYGQNERTFFSFLESTGEDSVADFTPEPHLLYNLVNVYNYIEYHFHGYLSETNSDSTKWSALRVAMERIEGSSLPEKEIDKALQLVKVIGLLNIFASASAIIDEHFLTEYAANALNMSDVASILCRLTQMNIIRYAKYKSKYILFEGTDVDIDAGIFEADRMVQKGTDIIAKLNDNFNFKVALANAYYYKIGTPRYFEYHLTDQPLDRVEDGEADGYINLVFASPKDVQHIRGKIIEQQGVAIVYCLFKNIETIVEALFKIDKLFWVKENYVADHNDVVALRELDNQIAYEREMLSKIVIDNMFNDKMVEWIFNGESLHHIDNQKKLTSLLSKISSEIYSQTPVFKNEMVNKHKASSSIATARPILLNRLLDNENEENLGFAADKFPPEKSIYLSLLKQNEMHRFEDGNYVLSAPKEDSSFYPLWKCCMDFLESTQGKPRRFSELVKTLQQPPFRLKQGFIEFWLPIFLIIKKDDFALYSDGTYVPKITREVLELLQRRPNQFTIKAFSLDGVKMQFFQQYRTAINLNADEAISSQSFIQTIRPFLQFYKQLNTYTRLTKKLSPEARKFRDVIATATDPEKTFFEVLPEKLGFREVVLTQNPEAINSFVGVLHQAIRDLRECYDELIDSIEQKILSVLKISETDFLEYKKLIDSRYANVKSELMPLKSKNFHSRVVSQWKEKRGWIESVCYVLLNKPLDSIKDEEIPFLFASLQDAFFSLDDFVEMHKVENESVVRFHISQNKQKMLTKQVVLAAEGEKEVEKLEKKIEEILSSDDSLNINALIKILKKKME